MRQPRPVRRHDRRSGFSLLEAMVGVAIATTLIGALALFTANLSSTRERLARISREIECVESLFSTIERGCASAVVSSGIHGSGVSGDATTLRIVRSSVGLGNDGQPAFSDETVATIAYDTAGRRISIVRGMNADTLGAPVRRMRIRYLAERGWEDSFDSGEEQAFPVGIEVSVWFDRDGDAGPAPVDGASDADLSDEGSVAADAFAAAGESQPDRRRFFRCMGGPKVDALAIRSILDESGRGDAADGGAR